MDLDTYQGALMADSIRWLMAQSVGARRLGIVTAWIVTGLWTL